MYTISTLILQLESFKAIMNYFDQFTYIEFATTNSSIFNVDGFTL